MIDQPELGNKLLSLRKEKGMTQHELREKSHVSVRTIQRIESGAVMPRVSTLKILLDALGDSNPSWFSANSRVSIHERVKNLFLVNPDINQIQRSVSFGGIAGVIFLLMSLLNFGIDFLMEESQESVAMGMNISVKGIMILSFFWFTRGYLGLAVLFENRVLKISSYLYMVIFSFFVLLQIATISFSSNYEDVLGITSSFSIAVIGAVATIFGIGLIRLQDGVGRIARIAGKIEVVYGVSYMTLVFSFIGIILLFPMIVIEVILLFKAEKLFEEEIAS